MEGKPPSWIIQSGFWLSGIGVFVILIGILIQVIGSEDMDNIGGALIALIGFLIIVLGVLMFSLALLMEYKYRSHNPQNPKKIKKEL